MNESAAGVMKLESELNHPDARYGEWEPAESATRSGPVRRRLTTLFVDIAGSTSLLVHHQPEVVLGVVQCFLGLVAEAALVHSGHVKDYEGDGALLYFESTRQAVQAALLIRAELARGRCEKACGAPHGSALTVVTNR